MELTNRLIFIILGSLFFFNGLEAYGKYKHNNFFDKFDWKEIYEEDGIKVYSYEIEGTSILAFKARATIIAPIENISSILRDVKVAKEWDSSLIEKRTVHETSDLEAITYSINNLPWPVSNRDLILHNRLYLDRKNKFLVVHIKSVKHKDFPPEKSPGERAHMSFGVFYLRPLSKNKMYIELKIHIDPKGLVPSWIANMVQKGWPVNFIKNLQKQALKPSPPPIRPQIKALQDELIKDLIKMKKYKK